MAARRTQLIWLILSIVAFACTGARCSGETRGPSLRQAADKPRPDLRLLVLTDPKGYLEPCGCQMRPLGGVDKLASVVAKARADGIPTAVVAAGDLAFGTELRPEDQALAATQESWRAEALIQAWNEIGLTAVAPGRLDLRQPSEQRGKLVQASKFPWLLNNLAGDAATSALPLRSQPVVVDVGGIKVGMMGLAAPDPTLPPEMSLEAELASVAKRAAAELRAQGAKLVVALVSGDRRSARALAGKGIDVVVMGGVDIELPLAPALHDDTIFVHAGRQGQRVVALELELDGAGARRDASAWTLQENKKVLSQQVSELRAKVAEWQKSKSVAEADVARQRARLAELEAELAQQSAPSYEGRWFAAEVTELAPEVTGDKQVAQALDAYDRRVNAHNKEALADRAPLPAKAGEPFYVGSESCKSCHEDAYTWWRNTKHGRAYATLEKAHKEFNLNCVSCHVTGYNQPGGSTVTHVDKLKDVGCETCHGPGSAHSEKPHEKQLIARDTPEHVCTSCHTHEHSDRFVYEAFKPLLIVPGHGMAPTQKAK